MKELEKLYSSVVAKAPDSKLDNLLASDTMHTLEEGVAKICETLSCTSKTSQLWLNYQYMLEVARTLVKADRTGSWDMHPWRRTLQVPSNIRCCRAFQLLEIGLPLLARYDHVGNDKSSYHQPI